MDGRMDVDEFISTPDEVNVRTMNNCLQQSFMFVRGSQVHTENTFFQHFSFFFSFLFSFRTQPHRLPNFSAASSRSSETPCVFGRQSQYKPPSISILPCQKKILGHKFNRPAVSKGREGGKRKRERKKKQRLKCFCADQW